MEKKVATLKKSELKFLLKEILLEMKKSGELNEVLTSIGVNPPTPNQPQQRPQVNPTISLLASAATQDPQKRGMLESIFADTARSTVPLIDEAESRIPKMVNPGYGMEGYGNPAFTALNAYPGINQQPSQGYIPDQTPQLGYIDHNAPQMQQQPLHPLAKIAFSRPIKNTINDS